MKVILKKDVANVGLKNEVKEVANGYAQNFLIARGLAEVATPAKIQQAEKAATQRAVETQKQVEALGAGLAKLKDQPLVIHATANEKDHLFEAVHADTIAAHLKDVVGADVSADVVVIDAPIKELGDHTVHITFGHEKLPLQIRVESK